MQLEEKNISWTKVLNNAKKKEVFQAYKYTKSRSVEEMSFISHNNEIKIHFAEKCDALIEAIFPPPPNDDQKRPQKDFLEC